MEFEERYPNLFNFLGAWFPEADIEGFTDEQVVRNFINTGNKSEISKVKNQCKELLDHVSLPVEEISDEANRYFRSEKECREWLKMIFNILPEE